MPAQNSASDESAYAAQRMAAWEQRRMRRISARGMQESRKKPDFLSAQVEIDADVSYRFTFAVVGDHASQICLDTSSSRAAARFTGGSSATPLAGPEGHLRCHCWVSRPAGSDVAGTPDSTPAEVEEQAVARLAFHAGVLGRPLPSCTACQDAVSCTIVYTLDVSRHQDRDHHEHGETQREREVDAFSGSSPGSCRLRRQLQAIGQSMRLLRGSRRQRRLRPEQVLLLLCSSEVTHPSAGLEAWRLQVADFTQEHGKIPTFGPVPLEDAEILHGIFQKIAADRAAHCGSGGQGQVQAAEGGEGGLDDAVPGAAEEDELPTGEASESIQAWEDWADPGSTEGSPIALEVSSNASTASTATKPEVPPYFAAERSGSECSESALELHMRTFGTAQVT